jgi:hypothetical protein
MRILSGRKRLLFVILAAAALPAILMACNRTAPQPHSLIVLPGAKDVHYGSLKGTDQVRYELQVRYPAKSTLAELSNQLAKQGWKPLKNDFLNPKLPSSHVRGWTFFGDATRKPEETVRAWMADWTDAKGNVVTYALRYRSPVGTSENTSQMEVYGIYVPAKVAKAMQESVRKHMERTTH